MKPTLILIGTILSLSWANAQNITETQLLHYIQSTNTAMYGTQVLQLGNENLAVIDANKIEVTQNGDQQQFYYTETSILPSDFKINVEGNSNYVEVVGNNQIINNMTINIQGDNRNVIIRNYP
ncbi:MAG TPA: hypothetical protein VKY36_04740 [Moheibacter sp.]|nr:hypothetical protein [Moheibacter sp.]